MNHTHNRINWLLILQGWAMLWVVIGHAPLGEAGAGPAWENVLYALAYSFHMPLFMTVSGWLFYRTRLQDPDRWSYGRIVRDKALRLLLPGLVFSLVAFAVKIAFPGEVERQVSLSLGDILHAYLYPNDNPLRELWFIATLFGFFLLTPLWRLLLRKPWTMAVSALALAVLHYLHPGSGLLCIDKLCEYAIWFFLGLLLSKTNAVAQLCEKQPWWTLVAGAALYAAGLWIDAAVVTLGGIVFSFALALVLDRVLPRIFFSFRNYTYQIFLMGIFAQMAVKILYRHAALPYFPVWILCVAAGIYIPVLVAKVIEKIGWKPLSLCVGLK